MFSFTHTGSLGGGDCTFHRNSFILGVGVMVVVLTMEGSAGWKSRISLPCPFKHGFLAHLDWHAVTSLVDALMVVLAFIYLLIPRSP